MISTIYQDKTLLGHSLTQIPGRMWAFSKSEPSSTQIFKRILCRVLAPLAAILAFLTVFPIGFSAKAIHYGMRSINSLLLSKTLASFAIAITFQSPDQLQKALLPYSMEEVEARMASSSTPLTFHCDPESSGNNIIPIRNIERGNLLKHQVYHSDLLDVYYPESPRVPDHLAIALNSKKTGIDTVSEEENQAIFATIRKIQEIYKSKNIKGSVIAQYDAPQEKYLDRYVVEVIPHLPQFGDVKNIADKADSNHYVLFRHANLTPVICEAAKKGIDAHVRFWQTAFTQETDPLTEEDKKISFPYVRHETHLEEAQKIWRQQLVEILQDKGGKVEFSTETIPMPMDVREKGKGIKAERCLFCDPELIQRQHVFEYEDIEVLCNIRKGEKPGCTFLILPKNHKERVYDLTPQEIHNIGIVRKALVNVLREMHPEHEVITYIQDSPAVGQTVYHTHEQVVSVNPDTIAFFWTFMSLYPGENLKSEEMLEVRRQFEGKMQAEIDKQANLKEAV